MATFQILLDLRTYVDPNMEDVWVELNFVPQLGSNIYMKSEDVPLPEQFGEGAYFKVLEVDYLLSDNVFVVGLMGLDDFMRREQEENSDQ